jgi:hypothetical protein
MMIDFDGALRTFGILLADKLGPEAAREGRILRDVYGRLGFVTSRPHDRSFDDVELAAVPILGAYGRPAGQLVVSLSDEKARFEDLLGETSIGVPVEGQAELRMIDRRLAGDDWLTRPTQLAANPRRLIFYSVKGGVGRSTALAIAAAELATRGCNVLVIDLDLEAPGLGSLLLRAENIPEFGVTDWFAAVAAGADAESLVQDMTGPSPFTSSRAVVDVVPAAGRDPGSYLSKLARAYTPGSAGEQYTGFNFSRKADALLVQLASRRRYDAILIDARAGLHETSGGLILGLGARALLFGVDTPQTFDDFGLLFSAFHQAFDPVIGGEDLRRVLKMVHAKAPRDEKERQQYRERSWGIWSDYLYDDTDPVGELAGDKFVFDLGDDDAPHYPLEIIGDESYARFDPRTENYPLNAEAYGSVFGSFLSGVRKIVGLQ